MSNTLQEPALLQLLLPKPQGGAGLGRTLNAYADNLVSPRGCPPTGALGSQHHCLPMTQAGAAPITQLCLYSTTLIHLQAHTLCLFL